MHASGCSLIDLLIKELMHEETRYNNDGVRPQQASEDTSNAPVVRLAHNHISARDGFVATFVTDPKTEEEKRLLPNR